MNIIFKILIGIGSIIALLLIVALFVKNEYTVQRDILINKKADDVFSYIKFLKNQDHYSKWVMTDPDMKKRFRGADGTVGFVYAWDGNDKAGKGEQEIINIQENEKIDIEVRFIRPFAGVAQTVMTTEQLPGDQTKVNWSMSGSSPYPMNLMSLVMKGMLEKDLAISLEMLKRNLEK